MLFLVLTHVDANHGALVIKQEFGQRTRQLSLAHPGGANENKGTDRAIGVLQPGA